MGEYLIDGMIAVQSKLSEAAKEVVRIIEGGRAAELIVQPYSEKEAAKRRSNAQNKLVYAIYQRIAKTLHGGDESHTRRECKLLIGCRILRRDSDKFAAVYDEIIRPLAYESKIKAMELVSVSSIMSVKQGTEFIKKIIEKYTEAGVYFLDIEGIEGVMAYPEAAQ